MREQANAALELTKGFTPEQRKEFSNATSMMESLAFYVHNGTSWTKPLERPAAEIIPADLGTLLRDLLPDPHHRVALIRDLHPDRLPARPGVLQADPHLHPTVLLTAQADTNGNRNHSRS